MPGLGAKMRHVDLRHSIIGQKPHRLRLAQGTAQAQNRQRAAQPDGVDLGHIGQVAQPDAPVHAQLRGLSIWQGRCAITAPIAQRLLTMTPRTKALICHHLREAVARIEELDTPDDALILSAIDAQDAALVALNNGRLPAFLVRRAIAPIQRPGQGSAAV